MSAPELTLFSPDGSGGRLISFEFNGVRVSIHPRGVEQNEAALALAKKLSGAAAPNRLLRPTVARFDGNGKIWLLNTREKGWSAFGFVFDSWDRLLREWDVKVTGHGADEFGEWWAVENQARGEK